MQDINVERLQAHMRVMEGVKNEVYLDSLGKKTCGIGHLLKGSESSWPVGHKVSDDQVAKWFREDVAGAYAGARRIAGPAWHDMDPVRREVMIDAVFQLGEAGFRGYRNCVKGIHGRNYGMAAVEMLDSRGARQTPRRHMSRAKALVYGKWD